MSGQTLFPVPEKTAQNTYIDNEKYLAMYQNSIEDPESFWAEQGKRIDWL